MRPGSNRIGLLFAAFLTLATACSDPDRAILADMEMVAEGVKTTQAVKQLADTVGVEMPICDQVYQVIYEGKDPRLVPRELMVRELKDEREGTGSA